MIGETVQHKKYVPGVEDDYGYPKPATWVTTPVSNVGVDAGASYEPRDGTVQKLNADLTLYLPEGFTCSTKDRFLVRGVEYQVEGVAEPLRSMFTGEYFRTEVMIRRFA